MSKLLFTIQSKSSLAGAMLFLGLGISTGYTYGFGSRAVLAYMIAVY